MSDIQEKLDIIKHGTYGRDIRGALHDSIKDLSESGGGGGVGYIIAPPNATDKDKKKADLVLDDVNGSPHTQLADMVDMLHDRRGQNTDIAIVIEFCPGVIELPDDTNWEIPETKGNFYIYGNGVKIKGNKDFVSLLNIAECWLYGIIAENDGFGTGIYANNSTLSNCSCRGDTGIYAYNSTLSNCEGSSSGGGVGIDATNSTLSNCEGSDGGIGIYAYNSTLSNCEGSTEMGFGISVGGSCIIQGCDGTQGGISVPAGFVGMYPNTLTLLQAFNKGSIIEGN